MTTSLTNANVRCPGSLEQQVSLYIENLVRSITHLKELELDNCSELSSLPLALRSSAKEISKYILCLSSEEITRTFHRILGYKEGERSATAMDVWVWLNEGVRRLVLPENFRKPNLQKALIECLDRARFMVHLDLSGLDRNNNHFHCNDLRQSSDCRDHYLRLLEDSLHCMKFLSYLNVATLATNGVCRAVATAARHNLRELHMQGPCNVTDLGLRYLSGEVQLINNNSSLNNPEKSSNEEIEIVCTSGCSRLSVLVLRDVDRVSVSGLANLMMRLDSLQVLEHNQMQEALTLLKREMNLNKKLNLMSYSARSPGQCNAESLNIVREMCPDLRRLQLCASYCDSFGLIANFCQLRTLSIQRVTSMSNLHECLANVGCSLTQLELMHCTDFQSGTALTIRRECPNLVLLALEIDSYGSNNNNNNDTNNNNNDHNHENVNNVEEAAVNDEPVNYLSLQHQVRDLQSRLDQLQVTMLDVMDQYRCLEHLREMRLTNLSMGSLLILLPFAPNLRRLSLKYNNSDNEDDDAPNLSDKLFLKIFKKNRFQQLEEVLIWCKTLSLSTAAWFLANCSELRVLKNLSFWRLTEEEQIALWREGRHRQEGFKAVKVEF